MFGIGETELVIIVIFAFMLFGPDKLPGMGRTLGRVLRQFREASDGFTEVVQTNIMDPASEELEKSPKQRRREAAERIAEDADIETSTGAEGAASSEESAPAPRRESFAERKARLAAEKVAREAAASESATEVATSESDAGDEDHSEERTSESESAPELSVADLYTTSSHSSRYRERTEQDEEATTSGEEDGSVEA